MRLLLIFLLLGLTAFSPKDSILEVKLNNSPISLNLTDTLKIKNLNGNTSTLYEKYAPAAAVFIVGILSVLFNFLISQNLF